MDSFIGLRVVPPGQDCGVLNCRSLKDVLQMYQW